MHIQYILDERFKMLATEKACDGVTSSFQTTTVTECYEKCKGETSLVSRNIERSSLFMYERDCGDDKMCLCECVEERRRVTDGDGWCINGYQNKNKDLYAMTGTFVLRYMINIAKTFKTQNDLFRIN